MIKTFFAFLLVVALVLALVAMVVLALFLWSSLKQPPAHALIVEKYYVCQTHQALHGGIFGKGPTKRFFPPDGRQWCWRWEWKEIGKEEFKLLASKWYGADWNKEGDWWRSVQSH